LEIKNFLGLKKNGFLVLDADGFEIKRKLKFSSLKPMDWKLNYEYMTFLIPT